MHEVIIEYSHTYAIVLFTNNELDSILKNQKIYVVILHINYSFQ